MEKYSSGEIGFNLLGVCQDKLEALEKQLAEETTEFKQRFEIKLKKKLIKFFVSQLKEDIANEKSKRDQWEKDNEARTMWNHSQLIMLCANYTIELFLGMSHANTSSFARLRVEQTPDRRIPRR